MGWSFHERRSHELRPTCTKNRGEQGGPRAYRLRLWLGGCQPAHGGWRGRFGLPFALYLLTLTRFALCLSLLSLLSLSVFLQQMADPPLSLLSGFYTGHLLPPPRPHSHYSALLAEQISFSGTPFCRSSNERRPTRRGERGERKGEARPNSREERGKKKGKGQALGQKRGPGQFGLGPARFNFFKKK